MVGTDNKGYAKQGMAGLFVLLTMSSTDLAERKILSLTSKRALLTILVACVMAFATSDTVAEDQITRDDVYYFVRIGVDAAAGIDELDKILEQEWNYKGNNVSYLDAIKMVLLAERLVAYAANKNFVGFTKEAAKYVAESYLKKTILGKVVGSAWTIGSFAYLPIELGLKNIVKIVDKNCSENQIKAYFLIRNAGISHDYFMRAGVLDDELGKVAIKDKTGWIYQVLYPEKSGWIYVRCKPWKSVEEFFTIAEGLYDAYESSATLSGDKRKLKDALAKQISEYTLMTSCGSKWYQRFGLQLLEFEQGIQGGYSFDSICKSHDQCYGDCVTLRDECDNQLFDDAKKICTEIVFGDRDACESDAELFYKAVRDRGQSAFDEAQQACTSDSFGSIKAAVTLVLDRSGSMKEGTKLQDTIEASRAFVDVLPDEALFSLVSFSDNGAVNQRLNPVDQVRRTLDSTLQKISANGATNFRAGLELTFSELSRALNTENRAVLFMSDGEDNRSAAYLANKDYIRGIPVCTVGFGSDVVEQPLIDIADNTGCYYANASTENLGGTFQHIVSSILGYTVLVNASDLHRPDDTLAYQAQVSQDVDTLRLGTQWQGSMLGTTLVDPNGQEYRDVDLPRLGGRYEFGRNYQMLELPNPTSGTWHIETRWVDPPLVPEQVNILVTEKTDVMASVLPFDPQYRKGQPVTINVMAKALGSGRRSPLRNGSIRVSVQKPGPDLIRLVKAQSTNWSMYHDVLADNTRELVLYDDGQHNDYRANDGIFGNTFLETEANGAYFVRAAVSGERAGQPVSRNLLASFQVGPITNNRVTSSQSMQYTREARRHYQRPNPTLQQIENAVPLEAIDQLNGGDPLESIDNLMRSGG